MSFPITKWLMSALLISACWSQEPQTELSARELYYRERHDEKQSTSVKPASAPQAQQTPRGDGPNAVAHKVTSVGKPSRETHTADPSGSGGMQLAAERVPIEGVRHLGLRYDLVLINPTNGSLEPTDPERVFQPGECLALEFEANLSAYLYVLEQGSSGAWSPLLPSAEMPDESNILKARMRVRVPEKHCFEITGPPGEERIFVVLSRNPQDVHDLHQSIRNDSGSKDANGLLTQNLAVQVKRLEVSLQDRDLKVKKIAQPEEAGEPPNSVYVVNASSSSADRVVTEIRIEHR
jgi:Domain of unknown function (DUF4384)